LPYYFVKETDKICLKKTSGASHIRKLEKKKKRQTNNLSLRQVMNGTTRIERTNTPIKEPPV
jgi:hypothetical protein